MKPLNFDDIPETNNEFWQDSVINITADFKNFASDVIRNININDVGISSEFQFAMMGVAQLGKALLEGDKDGIKWSVGEIAISLVIISALQNQDFDGICLQVRKVDDHYPISQGFESLVVGLAQFLTQHIEAGQGRFNPIVTTLSNIASANNLHFMECCLHTYPISLSSIRSTK